MLPIWSECQATVLGVMVVDMAVYTEHISKHLGNNLSKEATFMASLMSVEKTLFAPLTCGDFMVRMCHLICKIQILELT